MAHPASAAYFASSLPTGLYNPEGEPSVVSSVLQDIMPILARIQSRSPRAPMFGAPGQTPVETVAAVALVGDLGADSLRRLTAYLDEESTKHEGLEHCVPLVTGAAQALAAYDYAQAFTLIFDCYRTIATLRVGDPSLAMPGSIKNRTHVGRSGEGRRTDEGDEHEDSPGPPH